MLICEACGADCDADEVACPLLASEDATAEQKAECQLIALAAEAEDEPVPDDRPEIPNGNPEASAASTRRFIMAAGLNHDTLLGVADGELGFPQEIVQDVITWTVANYAVIDLDEVAAAFARFGKASHASGGGRRFQTSPERILAVCAILTVAKQFGDGG